MPIILNKEKTAILKAYLSEIYQRILKGELEYKGREDVLNQGQWDFELWDDKKYFWLLFRKNKNKIHYQLLTHYSLEIVIGDSDKKKSYTLPIMFDTNLFVLDEETYTMLNTIVENMIGERKNSVPDIMENVDVLMGKLIKGE